MKRTIGLAAVLLAVAIAAPAQQQGVIEHTQPGCVRGGEMAVMHVTVHQEGTLQMYFRRTGSADWCMTEGTNAGPLSTVILPKFQTGNEVEYYFLLVQGRKVVAKSPVIYHVKNTDNCETQFARHAVLVTVDCLQPGGSPLSNSMGAGYSIKTAHEPPKESPERPSAPFSFTAP